MAWGNKQVSFLIEWFTNQFKVKINQNFFIYVASPNDSSRAVALWL